ncbi:MAG TPA: alcohol dehydrogenase catalytic domain-containing protein [Verrucomicrobiae bacterium]|nr:alcohol dehydrogenase catalytic domain-containing protein [Verrucomicrobiae bacterium]
MRAAVYRGPNKLRIETVPVPRIGPHELLVKVAVCGVCPTDIKKIVHGTVPPPRIFGHETAGTIARIGARVRDFKPGDRVALHHHIPCMDCHACRHRAFAQCAQYKRTGITAGFEPAGGGFAEYVRVMPFVIPGVVRIPARNSFEEGAMLEPVNTVLKAVKRLSLLPGDSVLVAGQGPIGLMFTKLLQLEGMKVLASDLMDSRLALAKKFGAKWTVKQSRVQSRESISSLSRRTGEGRGEGTFPSTLDARRSTAFMDAAVVAVPSDSAFTYALAAVRPAGQILLFAHTRRGAMTQVDLASVCVDEKDLLGSYSSDVTLQQEVARLVFGRKLDVRSLITHRFPLEQAAAAIELAAKPTPESLKILVTHGNQSQ